MFRKSFVAFLLLFCALPTWAATLYVEEFAAPQLVLYQGATAPSIAHQTVAESGSSTQSAAFQSQTILIRVHTDAICSIEISLNPTATVTTMRLSANQTEYFVVPKGAAFKIAVITNT